MIYFDNAATTQMSEVALNALMYASKECYGNPSSIYRHGKQSKNLVDEARAIVAKCIGAEPEEIFFTSCGTESDNWAVSQAISQKCERVITSKIEHHAILNSVYELEKAGMNTVYLPVDGGCVIDTNVLNNILDGRKLFVSIMYQNNETGVIQPIKKVVDMVHEDNALSIVHTDAIQAVGHVRIDVKELGVDMLSASAHKFNGPKGVGFLYIKKGCLVSPLILGGGQEKGLRSGTENVAGIYAMAKALEDNVERLGNHINQIRILENKLFEGLNENNVEYWINANNSERATGIINISIKDIDGEGLLNILDMHEICISIGSACNSKIKEPSYVLTSMGLEDDRIDAAVRISLGRYNSSGEIEKLITYIVEYYKLIHFLNS